MAEQSIFGAAAYPGTITIASDGSPNIRLGATFYQFGAGAGAGALITGGRVWTPVGSPATIRIMLWHHTNGVRATQANLDTVPVRSEEVPTNPGGWTEARWTGIALPANGLRWMIGYEFVGAAEDDFYVVSNFIFTDAVTNPTANIALSESGDSDPSRGPVARAYFRIGTGAVGVASLNYCIDTLVETSAGNAPPVANAGTDQTVAVNTPVTLVGAASTDSDGTIASYNWVRVSGPAVTLSGTGSNRTFTPSSAGAYVFGLTVVDNNGASSTQDLVTVNVTSASNTAPTARAGADRFVTVGETVLLDGSTSSDYDGTIASYNWVRTSGPAAVTLSGSGATRSFVPTTAGVYVFTLTVTDDDGSSGVDSINITAAVATTEIADENALSGHSRANWLDGLVTEQMPAFGRSTYYTPGQTAQFSVDYNSAFTFDVYRLGHYDDLGGRRVASSIAGTPTDQPAPVLIPGSNGAVTCEAWSVNASWAIPNDATPGWYSITLKGANGTDYGHVLFCVSDINAKFPVVIVTGDATWHAAYNGYGGNNVYGDTKAIGSSLNRALCSTYDKPVITRDYVAQTHFMNNTYPYLKWSERMGIEAGHTTIEQIKNNPTVLDGRALIVWVGHNEYIPQQVMDKTKALLASGTNMMNIAGNDFFWRVKFTDGAFGSSTNGRVMWCKKDTMPGPTAIRTGGAGTPFTTNVDWTGTWQDTRWSLREPSYQLFGDQFIANGIRADSVTVPESMRSIPAWRNCPGVQALSTGGTYTFPAGTLGMEWDEPHPSTTLEYIRFSSTTISLAGGAADANGENYSMTDTGDHAFMMVANGSSFVANFNSDQWGWALDSLHLRGSGAPDVNAQQMTLNVLYDLGGRGHADSIADSGLSVPTAVANVGSAYGLTVVDEDPPPPPVGGQTYITVGDTSTLNLTMTGDGSEETPYQITGVVTPQAGLTPTRMYYSDGTGWFPL